MPAILARLPDDAKACNCCLCGVEIVTCLPPGADAARLLAGRATEYTRVQERPVCTPCVARHLPAMPEAR